MPARVQQRTGEKQPCAQAVAQCPCRAKREIVIEVRKSPVWCRRNWVDWRLLKRCVVNMRQRRPSGILETLPAVFCVCALFVSSCAQVPEAPVPGKPPLASETRYEKLPSSKAPELARRDAETDFNNGHRILLIAGIPTEPSKSDRYLYKHYQIGHRAVAGCEVTEPLIKAIDAYNARMTELIREHYGKDVFVEATKKTSGCF